MILSSDILLRIAQARATIHSCVIKSSFLSISHSLPHSHPLAPSSLSPSLPPHLSSFLASSLSSSLPLVLPPFLTPLLPSFLHVHLFYPIDHLPCTQINYHRGLKMNKLCSGLLGSGYEYSHLQIATMQSTEGGEDDMWQDTTLRAHCCFLLLVQSRS